MAGREPTPEELATADVVADALGGRWESRDGEDIPSGAELAVAQMPPLAAPEKLWRARQSAGWEVLHY
jgi:hypothetical protein